ncbi:tyrosine-type recombinase/integrase [Bacillus sp. CGMCC 1.16607]|uniref:tyrosine-type recombinase/integrase n=1 Tax=Bacillus sp. CGMCC 1.16607 TaxID=3351842 RepID=UPI003634BA23
MLNLEDYEFQWCKEQFFDHLRRLDYSWETLKAYEKDMQFFKRFMLVKKQEDYFLMKSITKEDLLLFMDFGREMKHKPNTIARRISTLKSFYKFLVNELDYPIDVAARIRLPKVYIPLKDILTENEVKLLLHRASEKDSFYHLFFSIIYYTGSRLSPVRTLEKKNVLLEEKIFYFPKVKGGKDLYLPIHNNLVNLIKQHYQDPFILDNRYVFPSRKFPIKPVSAADIRLKLTNLVKVVGINKKVTPHAIRHCTATHLTIKKIDQRTIATILGHSDLRSTLRYQHLSIEHLREPINYL